MRKRLCLPVATIVLTAAVGCARPATRTTAENKQLVRRYFEEVFNTGAVDRLPDFVAPEYVEVYDGRIHPLGLEGARAHVLGVRKAFPDLQITIEQQIAEDDWVASRITFEGTHLGDWLGMEPTGKAMVFTGVNLNRVVEGRIVEHGGAANMFGPLLEAGAIRIARSGDDQGSGP